MTTDISHLGGSDGGPGTRMPDIWERLVTQYDLCSVLDIGCGEGNHTRWWHDRGLYTRGVDGFPEYIEHNRMPRENLVLHDYTKGPYVPEMAFDLGWSSEFVEHVEPRFVSNFMATFARCKHVCLTHATPGQGGYHHVNEQLTPYWIEKFAAAGFDHDQAETDRMRATGPNTSYGRRTLTWFNRRGPVVPVAREEGRYEYPLTRDSVVVDGGGYCGTFCRGIAQRYGCLVYVFEPVTTFRDRLKLEAEKQGVHRLIVHPMGLASSTRSAAFHIQNDSSGAFAGSPQVETVQLHDVRQVVEELGQVDLMKLNIEGGEFEVLEALIESGLIDRIRFLQVQWHDCVPGCVERRRLIKGRLFKTHRTTWEYPWVWENYERK